MLQCSKVKPRISIGNSGQTWREFKRLNEWIDPSFPHRLMAITYHNKWNIERPIARILWFLHFSLHSNETEFGKWQDEGKDTQRAFYIPLWVRRTYFSIIIIPFSIFWFRVIDYVRFESIATIVSISILSCDKVVDCVHCGWVWVHCRRY